MMLLKDRRVRLGLLLTCWATALIGYFGPWIGMKAAALAWNAYDLFDLLRLLPEIETGALSVYLQSLRLPLVGLAILLPVLLVEKYWRWRLIGGVLGAGLALATLPPYPEIIDAWRTPGWRIPFWWGIGAMVASLVVIWIAPVVLAKLGRYCLWLVLVWLAVTGLPAVATMRRLMPAIRNLYVKPVGLGWGFWLCMLSFGVLALLILRQVLGIGEDSNGEHE